MGEVKGKATDLPVVAAVSSLPAVSANPDDAPVAVDETTDTVLAANANRVLALIQNVGVNPVYLRFGAGCSTANYQHILAPGAAAGDGKGSSLVLDWYLGIITAVCGAGLASVLAVAEFE